MLRVVKRHEAELVVVEEYAFGARGRGLSILHELGGVVKNKLHRREQLFICISATKNKAFATGNGQASKDQMIEAAQPWIPGCKDDNIADALHLARWGMVNYASITEEG